MKPDWKKLFIAIILITMFLVLQNACNYTEESCYINYYFYTNEFMPFFYIEMVLFLPLLLALWGGVFLVPFALIAYIHISYISFIIERFSRPKEPEREILTALLIPLIEWVVGLSFFVGIALIIVGQIPYYIGWSVIILIFALPFLFAAIVVIAALGRLTRRLNNPTIEFILLVLFLFLTYFYIRVLAIRLLPSWM